MLQFSDVPVVGGREVKNSGFGNRCVLCGGHFDEAGICNYGHQKEQTYYYLPPSRELPRSVKVQTLEET
jgi:hypothetical protein